MDGLLVSTFHLSRAFSFCPFKATEIDQTNSEIEKPGIVSEIKLNLINNISNRKIIIIINMEPHDKKKINFFNSKFYHFSK